RPRLHGGRLGRCLLRPAVEASEMQRAGRAGEDGLGDLIRACGVDDHPRACVGVENLRQAADAVAHVDAELRLPLHLDRLVRVDAPRATLLLWRGVTHSTRSSYSVWR